MRLRLSAVGNKHTDSVAAAAWVTASASASATGIVGSQSTAAAAPSLLTCADNGTWHQYSADGEYVGTVARGLDYGVCDLSVSPSGDTVAAACADGTLRLLSVLRGEPAATSGGSGAVSTAGRSASSAGTAAVGASGGVGRLIQLREERKVVASSGGEGVGAITCVRWSPDGSTVATGGEDGCVKVWSRAGMLRTTLVTAGRPIYSLAWNADGSSLLYACGRDLCIAHLGEGGAGVGAGAAGSAAAAAAGTLPMKELWCAQPIGPLDNPNGAPVSVVLLFSSIILSSNGHFMLQEDRVVPGAAAAFRGEHTMGS